MLRGSDVVFTVHEDDFTWVEQEKTVENVTTQVKYYVQPFYLRSKKVEGSSWCH